VLVHSIEIGDYNNNLEKLVTAINMRTMVDWIDSTNTKAFSTLPITTVNQLQLQTTLDCASILLHLSKVLCIGSDMRSWWESFFQRATRSASDLLSALSSSSASSPSLLLSSLALLASVTRLWKAVAHAVKIADNRATEFFSHFASNWADLAYKLNSTFEQVMMLVKVGNIHRQQTPKRQCSFLLLFLLLPNATASANSRILPRPVRSIDGIR
jgi:hypothetical protein